MNMRFKALLALASVVVTAGNGASPGSETYALTGILRVGGDGGWDFLTVEPALNRLYVPRFTHTMVLDAASGAVVADVPGQKKSHGVAVVPRAGRGFISDGEDGTVVVFDLATHAVLGRVKVDEDADGILYDESSDRVLVGCEEGGTLWAIPPAIDLKSGKALRLKLGGEPELFVPDGNGKVYVNLKDKNQVAVVDIRRMKILHRWSTLPGGEPTGIGLDQSGRHLFIGCRDPQRLIVMRTDTGAVVANLPLGPRNDGVVVTGGRAYACCADGTISVVGETTPGRFEIIEVIRTKAGARTMGYHAGTVTFYLPTTEYEASPSAPNGLVEKPGGFMILVVSRK